MPATFGCPRLAVTLSLVGLLTLLGGLAPRSHAQETPPSTDVAPEDTAAAAPNPLRSPRSTVAYFFDALEHGRTAEAARCLDFGAVDPEVVKSDAARYVGLLADLLIRLEANGLFDRTALPDDPTAPTQTLGQDPVLLVLERTPLPSEADAEPTLVWRFSQTTVADIPELHAQLNALDEASADPVDAATPAEDAGSDPAAATTPPKVAHPFRSPFHLVQNFREFAATAKNDPAEYANAMAALDWGELTPDERQQRGPRLVDELQGVLDYLVRTEAIAVDDLPKEDAAEQDTLALGAEPFLLLIAKQPDQSWRFTARSIAKVPDLFAAVKREADAGDEAAERALLDPFIRRDTSSPQATINLFLTSINQGDYETAVRCLDIARLSETEQEYAPTLAGKLWLVLNRLKKIVPQDIPADPDADEPYVILRSTAGRIVVDRVPSGERAGEWLFTPSTVAGIDRLYLVYETEPVVADLRDRRLSFWQLPALYVREYWIPNDWKQPLWGLQEWQWYGLFYVVGAGLLVKLLTTVVLPRLGAWWFSTRNMAMLPQVWRRALRPTADLLTVLTWWGGLQLLDLGVEVMAWAWWILRMIVTIVAVFAAYRVIDVLMAFFSAKAAQTVTRLDDVLVPLIQKTSKVVVIALGLILIAGSFGFQITPLLAGFGIGGLAFGLAAQDTLKNFFGSVNVVLDRPFQVGDWVRMGDVEGTVESVGLRSSRIRTFYNSEVTVPNSEIMNTQVDNMGRRKYRRMKFMVSVTYDTKPEQLEAFTEGIRELIRTHPYTRKDYYFCYVNQFAASSIDILLYAFLETPDWATELRERHRMLVDIVRLAKKLDVDFAFPTQTLHVYQEQTEGERGAGFPQTTDDAFALGRERAQAICAEFLPADKPPPVQL